MVWYFGYKNKWIEFDRNTQNLIEDSWNAGMCPVTVTDSHFNNMQVIIHCSETQAICNGNMYQILRC